MNDVLGLFLADLNRAAEGLKQSLALGAAGTFHASLHARDLGDALHGVELREHAELAIAMSHHLASGVPGLDKTAQDLLAIVGGAVEKISAGVAPRDLPEDPRLADIAQTLSAFEEPSVDSEMPSFSESLASDQQASEEDQVFEWQGVDPAAVAKPKRADEQADGQLASQSLGAVAPHVVNGLSEQRISQGLASVKAMERELEAFLPADAIRRVRYALSDHANWLVGLRQFSLERLLVDAAEQVSTPSVGVDADVAALLQEAFGEVVPVGRITGSVQQMTVFLRLTGVLNKEQTQARLARWMQKLFGRIESAEDGLELVFPSSLKRLRIVPFRRAQRLHAVSWAQFVGAQTLQADASAAGLRDAIGSVGDARLSLQLKSGQDVYRVYATEVKHFEMANAYRLSDQISAEPWVRGLVIGQGPEPALWVDPKGA